MKRVFNLFFFGVLLVNWVYFLFVVDQFDHIYRISSEQAEFSAFSFNVISALAILAEHTGLWISLPFFAHFLIRVLKVETSWVNFTYILGSSALAGLFWSHLNPYPGHVGSQLSFYISNFISKDLQTLAAIIGTGGLAHGIWNSITPETEEKVSSLVSGFVNRIVSTIRLCSKFARLTVVFFSKPFKVLFQFATEKLKGKPILLPGPNTPVLSKSRMGGRQSFESALFGSNAESDSKGGSKGSSKGFLFSGESNQAESYESSYQQDSEGEFEYVESRARAPMPEGEYETDVLIGQIKPKRRKISGGPEQSYFDEICRRLEEKLLEFKIECRIINVLKGPVVDTFELELGAGVKVSKVTGITEDLSLALSGAPIRLVYPLKGKTTMGIEVPRNPREIIYLDDVLKNPNFRDTESFLPIAMGRDAFGDVFVTDLAKMPHMLVAGSTGAGKSVFVNTLLVSLLVQKSPEELKLILIDPKQLELALYANLPHLILPVITESRMASASLLWACEEMERRYTILKQMGVRNIEGFNRKLENCTAKDLGKIQDLYDDSDESYHLPYIVVIVDEFADLILTKMGKDIETNICRLAAKARAAGIHLVLATQRPSVDVITGLIKSNFPTRVSFRVTSPIDSRTILNSMGAEKLLGKGDMLYKHGIEMLRVHSAYIDEDEIEQLVETLTGGETPEFNERAVEFVENPELASSTGGTYSQMSFGADNGEDELYSEAVRIVCELRAASASMLQRRLKIGYNRAANLIESLESNNVIGPQQGSKPRKVLISVEDRI